MLKQAPAPCVSFDTTHEVRDACLCLHVQRAARRLARRFDDAFRPVGLTSGQFSLLMGLNRPEPASIGSLAGLLAMDRTTLTAAVKPLERRGLLEVHIDPKDRRSRLLTLTPDGMAVLAEAEPIWRRTHAAVESQLPAGEVPRLRAGLAALA
ncbi:MarR family winged helix-turn-helix transcriptional regulator [Phenylobacterium montanum]|uniref:MarR family transcriptional regulator n=1 Tax=Phenylobacterium montanum TaxID=2823693 RepID=A0A975FY10_9CAUL|nr:MarR family transcriptional regulator [Caulobacter sp. S6]QUD87385.1 MarR family transcriptional regulator [Caulobacter sp. S6]